VEEKMISPCPAAVLTHHDRNVTAWQRNSWICGLNARVIPPSDLSRKDIDIDIPRKLKFAVDALDVVRKRDHADLPSNVARRLFGV
jgi:hypothetical protein